MKKWKTYGNDWSYILGRTTMDEVDLEENISLEEFKNIEVKEQFGVEKLLLEGGGFINGAVIEEELIDEISLMILPFVVNNIEAPELFYSNPVIPKVYNFKLEKVIHLDKDVVRLRYLKAQ